jgi:serine/threonine protein kinase
MTSRTPPPPPPAFEPLPDGPGRYEDFELVELIGEGTFARVYRARRDGEDKAVALKISREPVSSEETALRALREIRILGTLTNPNVVHIYDHGLGADERWFMVMELLLGGSLTEHHDFDEPMSPREACEVVHQACIGLDEAHRADIVHRDVKPDNLWRMPDGTIKMLDFGLARSYGNDATIGANATAGHMLIGTPHYAQPEQVQAGKLTPASDVYSLGVILYELLCGRTPLFVDETVSAVRNRLRDEPLQWLVAHVKQPVIELDRYPEGQKLPLRLKKLIYKCLAKDPAARPQTAGALANELAWLLHGEFGGEPAAILHETGPLGAHRAHVVLPGVHRVGFGPECDIQLGDGATDADEGPLAILEWTGAPREAEVRTLADDGSFRVNGHVLDYRVRLVAGTKLQAGNLRLELEYPSPDKKA